jgi:glycosyltransferase involved in cell wall biosynthesis
VKIIYLGKKKGLDFSIILKLRKIFKQYRPDVIHSHLYALKYVVAASYFLKIPKIHTVHNMAEKEAAGTDRKLNKLFYKFSNLTPVAISPVIQDSISKLYSIKSKNIPMIYNGRDFSVCTPKNDYTVSGAFTFLHIGRFSEQKNHLMMIYAFKKVYDKNNNVKLELIGEGNELENVVQKVQDLGLSSAVKTLGVIKDASEYIHKADAFILPSKWEGMPITLIEAMAVGSPIVATAVGGVTDMLEHNKTGLLCEVNVDDIAEKMLMLVNDDSLRERLGTQAKITSTAFSVENMAEYYIELFKKKI